MPKEELYIKDGYYTLPKSSNNKQPPPPSDRKARFDRQIIVFPVWLRNRLLSAELEKVHSQTKNRCIASKFRQFSTNVKIKLMRLIPALLARTFGPSEFFLSCNQ